jgi:hypothetical protein
MNGDALRRRVIAQLEGGQAYAPVEEIVRGFPPALAGRSIDGLRHTAWEILEHLRIAQWDIMNSALGPDSIPPPLSDEHWPKHPAPEDGAEWQRTVDVFLQGLERAKRLASDPSTDLGGAVLHDTGETILRRILLIADHNAYHLGQLMMIRRALERAAGCDGKDAGSEGGADVG